MEWISVNDRLPDKEGKYLVFMPSLTDETRYYASYYACGNWGVGEPISHWMPLPAPPKEST
jgi:hypothetical protein